MLLQRKQQKGMALIFVMIAIVVILAALGIVMTNVQSAKHDTDNAYAIITVEEAAQAGVDMAVTRLWSDYIANNGNTTGNWASFRYYLDNVLQIPKNEDLNFNGVRDADEAGNGDAVFDQYPTGYNNRGWAMPGFPKDLLDPSTQRVLATVDSVHIGRYDGVSVATLTVTATASFQGRSRSAVQVLSIGGSAWPGTQFAILANNISCILCHAEFKSLPMEINTDPTKYGTFDRIKIAALESMLVRKTEAYSNIAGTIYTRGRVYDQNLSEYTASGLAASTFKSYNFRTDNGKIIQNSSGAMSQVSLVNATSNPQGDLNQFANLYMNYPSASDAQTDGPLPQSFPAPYPDENENRLVDDSEFDVIVNSANGRIDFEYGPDAPAGGAITSGVAFGVPTGGAYSDTTLPTASNSALNSLESTGSYDGNLILVGTDDDPIIIDRTVAVDGDLVIKGPIRGYGQILVRGNAYVVGDVTYKDAPGEFGVDEDGNENAFALVAGGSIIMGDYLTVRGVNHTALNGDQYPNWAQYSIHSRSANNSNNVTLRVSGVYKTETLKWGYFDPYSVDPGQATATYQGRQYSFTTSELMLFNNLELTKALADSTYVPRFYGLRESQPNNVYVFDSTEEHAVHYSRSGVKLLSAYLTEKGYPLDILTRAVYQYCNPSGNWMSESTLRNIWFADEATRPSAGRNFKFDGLLYSNNSIWCMVRSKTRHYSNTNGSMDIRGGVLAADLGVFVPGNGSTVGLNLQYDPRVERFLEVRDTNKVTFNRAAFYFVESTGA
ncbi:MAG TPA: hypothetical protein PLI09_19670 [Candidatus Hydrogenedentes bacterium]|nr:hypothetical protein [Candidatus Hydrogenedentota bacterium]